MDHAQYREQLSALLDGELDDAAREAVTAHLATCEDCRTYFAELTALRDALGDLEEVAVPDGFADGVMARVRSENGQTKQPKRRAWRTWAALAACAAVVVLAINALPRAGTAAIQSAPATADAPPRMTMAAQDAPSASAATEESAEAETAAEQADYGAVEGDWLESKMLYMTSGATETPAATDAALSALTEDAPEEPSAAMPSETTDADDVPELTLMGTGAAEWLAENAEPLGGGRWRVSVEAVNDLPDALSLVAVDLLQEPEDGTLIITFGTPENPQ